MALHMNGNNVAYFDSFRVEHIPKDIKKYIGNKNIATNICKIRRYSSIKCRLFCIGVIDFMLKGKSFLDHTSKRQMSFRCQIDKNSKLVLKYNTSS